MLERSVVMYYILFNPLSKNGASSKNVNKLEKYLQKKNFEYATFNLIDVSQNVSEFIKKLNPEDVIVIIGGDGTLHRFVNGIQGLTISNRIMLYKGGTGNDFSREFKGKLIDITDKIHNLPSFSVFEDRELFLNCTGFGVDGSVCKMVNDAMDSKKGIHYFKNAISLFKKYERYDLEVEVDGVRHLLKNVWLATVMNGKYFGGGMCLSPDSNRFDSVMELYVIHSVSFWKLILIFPLIFVGKHMWFKQVGITKLVGKKFTLKASRDLVFQSDGEVASGVNQFTCEI